MTALERETALETEGGGGFAGDKELLKNLADEIGVEAAPAEHEEAQGDEAEWGHGFLLGPAEAAANDDFIAIEGVVAGSDKVGDGIATTDDERNLSVGGDALAVTEKAEDAAFVQSHVEGTILRMLDEQTRLGKNRATGGRRNEGSTGRLKVAPGEEEIPRMVAEDVIIGMTGSESGGESGKVAVVNSGGLGHMAAKDLEAVGEEIVGIAAGVFAAEGAVGVDEAGGKADGFFQGGAQGGAGRFLVNLGEERNGERVVAGVAAFVFLEPALGILPLEDTGETGIAGGLPAGSAEHLADAIETDDDERLVVGKLTAFIVVSEPVGAFLKEGKRLGRGKAEEAITLHTGKEREGGGATGFFKRKIVVTGAVGMGATGGVEDASLDELAQGGLPEKRVAGEIGRPCEGERPDKLLGHAGRKVDDLVVPEIPVKAAEGGAVAVAILKSENLRNQIERIAGEEILIRHRSRGGEAAVEYPQGDGG